MIELPKVMTKSLWFALFNIGTVLYLIVTGTLKWNGISVVSNLLALLLINGIALISARRYKNWKWNSKDH